MGVREPQPCHCHNHNHTHHRHCPYLPRRASDDTPSLLPKDPFKRCQARAVAEMINSGIQPIQNLKVLQHIVTFAPDKKMEWGRHWIAEGFGPLERMLATTAGKFCVGDEVTVADLCLIPQIYNALRFSVDMTNFPNINRVAANCAEIPAFVAAHPDKQPDAQ
eukprot:TRINITY_DN2592_c0_g1_i2.p2 TRINITY_DN2592_c0_g1~~TRINITY_DN2592_c0_g1_i2.p2  ORF type:complete len:163 (+),score=25.39 TRINITY_DN2592_c0_g1_i2:137-625(+)